MYETLYFHVRYSREDESWAAVKCENGSDFNGSKIVVASMKDPRGSGSSNSSSKRDENNAVEIICQTKQVRVYAEYIEGMLNAVGMKVDLMFPNQSYPITGILDGMKARGVLFAVNVSVLDEQNRTATVRQLSARTDATAHTFSVGEAVTYIIEQYKKINTPLSQQTQQSVFSSSQNVEPSCLPRDIQTIVEFLVDDRDLSTMEFDKVIRFLVKTREDTLNKEYGGNIPPHLLLPPVGPEKDPVVKMKTEELQGRSFSP